jgi:cellulose synthase/poly-beta-1,6-N-acetylglucosamine synthase-like glycosyltransferase
MAVGGTARRRRGPAAGRRPGGGPDWRPAGGWPGRAGHRLLDAAPALTTLALLAVYPFLRYPLHAPLLAEVFRAAFLTFWIGYLIVNLALALRTRRELLANGAVDWMARLRAAGAGLPPYVLLMPLKGETNRRVLAQTMRAVEAQSYPRERIRLVPIVEAEDAATLAELRALLPAFAGRLAVELFTYPAAELPTRCKATSLSLAGRALAARAAAGAFGPGPVRVMVLDADTLLHPQDLAFREFTHRLEAARARAARGVVLQSLTTYTANYWRIAMLPRLHNTGFVLYQMGRMQTRGDYLILGPGTSLDLAALVDVDFFEPNRHNEDMQFRYKVVMEGYRVAPLKLPTWGQAPWTTGDSWDQIARWARGAVDVRFIATYRRRRPGRPGPLRTKAYLAVRALVANAMPPAMVLLPAQLILISWFNPFLSLMGKLPVFTSPDVLLLKHRLTYLVNAMAAFNIQLQTAVLACAMLVGMAAVPYLLGGIIYQPPPRRWRRGRQAFEWFRLTFTPFNLHNYLLMASAQLYTQTRLALGFSIAATRVTRK